VSVGRDVERSEPSYGMEGIQNDAVTLDNILTVLQNIKIEVPYTSASPLPCVCLRALKTYVQAGCGAHACNSSYSRGRALEDLDSRAARAGT
jgi:hypothetical protein